MAPVPRGAQGLRRLRLGRPFALRDEPRPLPPRGPPRESARSAPGVWGPGAVAAMRYAILADVHANLEALDAVLDAARAGGADRIVCAGDLVGYHADPDACI